MPQTQTGSESDLKQKRVPLPYWDKSITEYKCGIGGERGNTPGCPKAQLCTCFLRESLIKPGPARCSIMPRHMP